MIEPFAGTDAGGWLSDFARKLGRIAEPFCMGKDS
jgi:hypothetical protein